MFLMLLFNASAQIIVPSKWTYKPSKTEVKVGETIELIFLAEIIDDWYMYSNDFDPNLGPMLTEFKFKKHPSYELVGKVTAIKPKEKYDEIWGGKVRYFVGKAEFRQKVKIISANVLIEGSYEGQCCTDIDGKCIPFEGDFSFTNIKVNGAAEQLNDTKTPEITETEPKKQSGIELENNPTEALAEPQNATPEEKDNVAATAAPSKCKKNKSISTEPTGKSSSIWGFFVIAFLSGIVALITPCVFPMIPMTVTFFTRSSKSRAESIRMALLYGLFIILLYTVAGTIVARINGPEFANFLSTHWAPNIFFFLVFVIFGLSFLGMFEIVLPSSWVNSADRQADKGGIYGVFFMAFTLVLVSFSCTGPIVGTILVQSAGGEVIKPIAGMFGFSLAFALPFTLFAIFPQWLSSLPKSGGWLNSVKVVLGFLELALALKFLSIADQAYHWRILDREVFLAAWIVIFAMIGFYILGKIRMPHDSEVDKVSVPRAVMAIITFSFVIYMLPGMWGAPLKALSGYIPPQSTLDFNLAGDKHVAASESNNLCEPPLYADFLHFPHGLKGYFDYEQALRCAQQLDKPVFVDFTGHGCVNCREMEANVWSDPRVLKILQEEFVLLALYVDDKLELPEAKWYKSTYDGKIKKTIGKQNADLQVTRFNNNAQPYYVILCPDGELLVQPIAYDLNVENFIQFLKSGLEEYKKVSL
jgi:thiol:disulfide interchange protein DsbD